MKKITLLTILNLLVITLFGQMFMEGLPHPSEPDDEAYYMPNTFEQFQLKQAEKIKLDSGIFDDYDTDLEQWNTSAKSEYTYNEDEHIILRQFFTWNYSSQQFELGGQYEYAYDNDGNRTLYLRSSWDMNMQQWVPDFSYEYTYDSEGRLTTRLYSASLYTQELSPYSKNEYTYNSSDELIQYQYSIWESDTEEWRPFSQYDYTYDNGLLISRLRSAWNSSTQQWSETTRYEYTYDSEGDYILYMVSNWDSFGELWTPNYKYDYTFDSNRNLTTELFSGWDDVAQQWMAEQVFEFTYDNSYPSEDVIIHFSERYTRHKMLGYTAKEWDANTQEWLTDRRGNYYFSDETVGITPATETGIEIFPNPTNDVITFNLENTKPTTIQLYDAQGKYLQTQALAQNNQVSVRHLDSGLYFYQLQHDGEVFGGKFMVK